MSWRCVDQCSLSKRMVGWPVRKELSLTTVD